MHNTEKGPGRETRAFLLALNDETRSASPRRQHISPKPERSAPVNRSGSLRKASESSYFFSALPASVPRYSSMIFGSFARLVPVSV